MTLGGHPFTLGRWAGVALLLIVALATLLTSGPPAVEPPTSDGFDVERALAHVRALSANSGPTGTAGNAARRRYIEAQLDTLAVPHEVQSADAVVGMLGRFAGARVHNVVARIQGAGPGHAVLLLAHYDTVPNSPGASDDGSGVATLLEAARVLRSEAKLPHDVILLFTDGEELGLLGANAFVNEHRFFRDVTLALNFDARGSRGPSAMYETSGPNRALVSAFATVPYPVGSSLLSTLSRFLPNDTDFTVFRRAGVAGFAFAFADGLLDYHHATDDAAHLDPRSLAHHGSHAVGLTRAWLHRGGELGAGESVYFDVFGRSVVRYPAWLARALGVAILGALVAAVYCARRDGSVRLRGVLLGVLAAVACLVVAPLVAIAADAVFAQLLARDRRIEWAAPLLVSHVALGLAACIALYRFVLRRASQYELLLGTLAFGSLLSCALGLALPGASFAPQWITGAALLGFLARARRERRAERAERVGGAEGARRAERAEREGSPERAERAERGEHGDVAGHFIAAVGLVPAAFFVCQVGYAFFVLVGTALPAASAVAVGWGAALFLPWSAPFWGSRVRPIALVLTGVGALVPVVLAVRARSLPPPLVFTDLSYALDRDDGQAGYFAHTGREDPWVEAAVAARAPVLDLAASELSVRADERTASGRKVTFELSSPLGARCVSLLELTGARVAATRVNGVVPRLNLRFGAETDKKLWTLVTGERLTDAWNLSYCGSGERPLRIELETEARALRLQVTDLMDGLPPFPPGTPVRPAGVAFDVHGNRTRVSSAHRL